MAEPISSYAHSPVFGHAAFQIDWGGGPPTGVQQWPNPGHRMAVMGGQEGQPVDNVVGMSWLSVPSAGDEFGPNVVVQEFARIEGTFVVGTAWTDSNTNGTLDFGEGLDSVTVTLDHGEWHAQTLSEGGFVLPVVAHEQYVIEFRRDGYKPLRQIIEVGDINVLVNVALTPAV